MKSNLILKKYETEPVIGTKQMKDITMFFGGKIFDIENEIFINDDSIEYSHFVDPNLKNTGYQFLSDSDIVLDETIFSMNLFDIKNKYHTISLLQQPKKDLMYNSKWELRIDLRSILENYIFANIKKSRAFKCISYFDVSNKDINLTLYKYIRYNLLGKYYFSGIDFYVQYFDISNPDVYLPITLKYDPIFDSNVELDENEISNLNIVYSSTKNNISKIILNYNQIYPSTNYKFDYYFNINFKKI